MIAALGSTDHKRVAVRIVLVAAAFFAAAGVMALVMRAELASPGLQVVSTGTYNVLFTMHGSTMIYLFVTPFALALGVYFVPLQVGAAEIAVRAGRSPACGCSGSAGCRCTRAS